jgi:hypothetical protein
MIVAGMAFPAALVLGLVSSEASDSVNSVSTDLATGGEGEVGAAGGQHQHSRMIALVPAARTTMVRCCGGSTR